MLYSHTVAEMQPLSNWNQISFSGPFRGNPRRSQMPGGRKPRENGRHQYRIELVGKRRSDGSLFVTSPNLVPFSAVLVDGNWQGVLSVLKTFLTTNFGPVKDLRL